MGVAVYISPFIKELKNTLRKEIYVGTPDGWKGKWHIQMMY
jgi:hypothetical protein